MTSILLYNIVLLSLYDFIPMGRRGRDTPISIDGARILGSHFLGVLGRDFICSRTVCSSRTLLGTSTLTLLSITRSNFITRTCLGSCMFGVCNGVCSDLASCGSNCPGASKVFCVVPHKCSLCDRAVLSIAGGSSKDCAIVARILVSCRFNRARATIYRALFVRGIRSRFNCGVLCDRVRTTSTSMLDVWFWASQGINFFGTRYMVHGTRLGWRYRPRLTRKSTGVG